MRLAPLALFVVTSLLACSSSSGSGGAAGSGGGGAAGTSGGACATDARAQTFTAGMESAGMMGLFRVRLLSIDPEPAIKGTNAWIVEIVDASGAPVTGATVTAKPFMPDHQHGSSIVPTVIEMGGGKYAVASLVLFMPGLWQTTIIVSTASAVDSAVFSFCIEG